MASYRVQEGTFAYGTAHLRKAPVVSVNCAIRVWGDTCESSGTETRPNMTAVLYQLELANLKFRPLFDQLEALSRINYTAHRIEPPTPEAFERARTLLSRLQMNALLPTRVLYSAEGGIGILFQYENRYADLEVLNSGSILGVTSDRRGRIEPFEVHPSFEGFTDAIRRIREHVNA
jgi:hypothetical protein